MSITKIPKFGKAVASYVKNKFNKKDPTISSVETKVNKTKLDKANSNLNIAIQKNKASKAKLGQTIFEMENPKFKGKDFTFKGNKGRSLKQSDKKKKIISDNNKVIGRMFKKVIEGDK